MHTVSPAPPAEGRLRTPEGVEVLVRTPTNYHADVAHRLLVVFAAAGMTPTASERFTGFTPPATRAGYIVAYPQHLRPSLAAIRKLARVAAAVSGNFCIDETKIFLSGHSDGGTAATAIAVQPASASQIAALAPSAAGFTGEDLAAFACPAPRPAMVWHGARDRLFPGWGRATARWWAACNQCDHTPPPMVDGCLRYAGCTQPVHYCEGDYGHMVWPADGAELTLKFFNSYQSDPKNAHESTAP
jgi:polyhydroxybutyrate depolymerase